MSNIEDMKVEAKMAIVEYLDSLNIPNGQVNYRLMTEKNPWRLTIVYDAFGQVVTNNDYTIEFVENGCSINTVPAFVPPMKHKTVESLMFYISRYNH